MAAPRQLLLLSLCLFLCGAVGQSITRPNSVCSGITQTVEDEGMFNDLISNAPSGYRVNIHAFSYRCGDTGTVNSEYYFKTGPSAGFEEIRWPWILHFAESTSCAENVFHTYTPLPLVIGEQTVGYLTAVSADNGHDLVQNVDGSAFGDSYLRVVPGLTLEAFGPFQPGSTHDFSNTGDICFLYTLDQFGGLARTRKGFELRGFQGDRLRLPALADGVYSVLSHSSLTLSARLVNSARGGAMIVEAGLHLADGHRFRLVTDSAGCPLLEVILPAGEVQSVLLDDAMASNLGALPIHFVDAQVTAIKTQLFASSFLSREACLQDPMLARYYSLGDVEELDSDDVYATARVTLTTEAFEVTLVVLEEASANTSTLKILSHKRYHLSGTELDTTQMLSSADGEEDQQGLLGVTVQPRWQEAFTPREHLLVEDYIFSAPLHGVFFD